MRAAPLPRSFSDMTKSPLDNFSKNTIFPDLLGAHTPISIESVHINRQSNSEQLRELSSVQLWAGSWGLCRRRHNSPPHWAGLWVAGTELLDVTLNHHGMPSPRRMNCPTWQSVWSQLPLELRPAEVLPSEPKSHPSHCVPPTDLWPVRLGCTWVPLPILSSLAVCLLPIKMAKANFVDHHPQFQQLSSRRFEAYLLPNVVGRLLRTRGRPHCDSKEPLQASVIWPENAISLPHQMTP